MSISYIPDNVKIRLWGKAGGRCQYEGCNQPLWLDTLTQAEFNSAYVAHIVADKAAGPRGDPVLSEKLKSDVGNLMLLCDKHHRLVDVADVDGHPVDRLRGMKERHEARMELLGSLGPEKRSHVVLYGANIGAHDAHLSLNKAAHAMLPDWYPAEARAIELGWTNSALEDRDATYWQGQALQLRRLFEQAVKPRLRKGEIQHLSVFGLAPQPMLMLLGHLLCDITTAEVYQLHREPPDWRWQTDPPGFDFSVAAPSSTAGPPALVFSLSATVLDERIQKVLPGASIWKLSSPQPHNDFLAGRGQAKLFRQYVRTLLDRIKAAHGESATLHVFPAMPVALAVEFGRVIMPKADMNIQVYDQNQALGGFVPALALP
jgi:hypothetical protein